MAERREPTFMCLGIQKAGTSWLYRMVKQHPEVCVSNPKEPHFFNREKNFARGMEWYRERFYCAPEAKAVGEFTPDYLWLRLKAGSTPALHATPDVAARVAEAFPDLRFIVCLRDPTTRAVSSYFHHIGAGRLSPNRRLAEVGDEWGILSMGHYADHLEHWFHCFRPERFQVLIYEEDLSGDAKPATLARVFNHLGADPSFEPSGQSTRYNERRSHFDYRLARLPYALQRQARRYVPAFVHRWRFWDIPVAEEELETLRAYYQPHNERLARLLGRELPW